MGRQEEALQEAWREAWQEAREAQRPMGITRRGRQGSPSSCLRTALTRRCGLRAQMLMELYSCGHGYRQESHQHEQPNAHAWQQQQLKP